MNRRTILIFALALYLGLGAQANATCNAIPLVGTGWNQDQVSNNTTGFALAEQMAPATTGAIQYRTDNTSSGTPAGGYCLSATRTFIGGLDLYVGGYRTASYNGTNVNDWMFPGTHALQFDVSGMINYNVYNAGVSGEEVCLQPFTYEYNGGPSTCPGADCTLLYTNTFGNVCHFIEPREDFTYTLSSPTAKNPSSNNGTPVQWQHYFRMAVQVLYNGGSASQMVIHNNPYGVGDPMGNNLMFVPHK
jgi:hypothetical protein